MFKYIHLCLFSARFGHPRAHHQEKVTVSMRHWYLSLCMSGVWCAAAEQTPPIQSDKYQCRIDNYSNFLLMMGTYVPIISVA